MATRREDKCGELNFNPDEIAANRRLTRHPEKKVLLIAERAAELGILVFIDGYPFGREVKTVSRGER